MIRNKVGLSAQYWASLLLLVLLISPLASAVEVQVRVSNDNDDVEELVSDGDIYRDSSDLELGYDSYHGGLQIVGMRFRSVNVPQGATINSAYIEFEVDESDSGTTNLIIFGEDEDDANPFGNNDGNVSTRTPTTASVTWSPGSWSTNQKQQTPDITTIIQEIVDRSGWAANNDMVVMIEPGSGCSSSSCQRTAEARDGESAAAPLLVIDYDTAPNYTVDNVHGACGVDDLMVVEYDNTINSDALDTSYYSLSAGSVTSVVQQSDTTVVLNTSGVIAGQAYTLTVGGVGSNVDFDGLTGHYFDQRNGSGTKVSQPGGLFTGTEYLRKDSQIVFSWGSGSPSIFPSVSGNSDNYSARWNGYLTPSQSGDYEFRLYSDDGVRLELAGTEIVNDWSLHGPRYSSTSAIQSLNAGQGYQIQMEFFEQGGGAVAQMQWRRDGGAWEAVPASVLSSCASTGSGSLTGKLNVDNQFDAYLSTDDNVQGVLLGSGSNWSTTETIMSALNQGQDYYLHIYARDLGGAAGFLGEFTLSGNSHTFENGAASLLTNGSEWRVSTTGWSSYQPASTYGANGVTPWGTRPDVDASAQWIWSSNNNAHNTNYFTTKISASSSSSYSVTNVHGACGVDNLLIVQFDSVIDSAALDTAYYALNAGTISSVTQQDDTTVVLAVTGIEAGQSYTLTVEGSDYSVDFAGLTGHYFDQRNGSGTKVSQPGGLFTGTEYLRSDAQVNFGWGSGTPTIFPNVSGNNDRFSVRWNGYIVPTQTGSYEFRMNSDDGVRLDFEGSEIVNDWSLHGPRNSSASSAQPLNSGQGYAVQMEFFEHTGGAVARLQWRRDGGSWEAIPAASLSSCAVTGVLPEPVVEFRMDETSWSGSSGDVVDSTSTPANGSSQNSLNTTGTAHLCRAGDFDGVDDYIQSAEAGSTLAGTSSMSFWLKTTQFGNNTGWQAPGIAGIEESGGADDIFWGWLDATGHIGISVGDDYTSKSTTEINNGVFRHVVLTRDAASGAYKIYIDGVLDKSGTAAAGVIGNSFSSIGRIEDTGGSPEYFQGQLDELKVYDRVLTDAQVSALFTETRSCGAYQPVAHFAFEQNAWPGPGSTIDDYSGSGNSGLSLGASQSHANGQYCKGSFIPDNANSATIDAIDSQIDLDSEIGNQGSILLWYRAETDWVGSGNRSLFDASTDVIGNANDKYFYLSKQTNGRLRFAFEDSADADFSLDSAAQSFTAGTWVHVGVTWNLSSNEMIIYVNGSESSSRTITSNGSLGDVGNVYFGDNSSTYAAPGASAFGRLDEIRLYDSELTEAEIATAMGDSHACTSCSLGSFNISQPAQGIVCPSTRAYVDIEAMCADGITTKTDYVGTIDLSTNESANSEFYAASSGGSEITSVSLDGSESGLARVYLFHNKENSSVRVTATDNASAVASSPANGTDFRVSGFSVTTPSSFECGNSESLTITAIGQDLTTTACQTLNDFTGSKSLKAWFEVNYDPGESPVVLDAANNPLVLAGTNVTANAEPASDNLSLNFNNGVASVSVAHLDAANIRRIEFKHDDVEYSGATQSAFTVKPASINVSVPLAPSCSAPFASVSCPEFSTVGDNFSTQVAAVCADASASTATSYQSGGAITLNSNLVAPLSGVNANLAEPSVSIVEADNGVATQATQQIDEVGVFTIGVSSAPSYFGETLDVGTSSNVGRFTPSRFDLSFTAGSFAPACNPLAPKSPFTYLDQSFQWASAPQLTISAVRADGSVTQNYEGDFWKLGASLQQDSSCSGVGSEEGFCYSDDAGIASVTLVSPTALLSYGDTSDIGGTLSFDLHPGTPNFAYNRAVATNVSPFPANVRLDVSLEDEDSVIGSGQLASMAFQFSSDLRQGRWKMENAYGPETADLKMKAFIEYFDASGAFVTHSDDECSVISATPLGPVVLGSGTTSLTVESPLDDAQDENFSFSAPLAGNTGRVPVNVDLSGLPWLRFDWDGNGAVEDHPEVEAFFGQYRGHDRIIYWREVSN